MIAGIACTAFGALAVAIALFEILDSLGAVGTQVRKLLGMTEPNISDMENAMSWVRILGLLIIGGAMLVAGYSTLGA